MELLDNLYFISDRSESDFAIRLNPDHVIYKAHFPGEPVTPGVVLIQISVELLQLLTECSLQLSGIRNVKFLRTVNPIETPSVSFSFQKVQKDEDEVKVQVIVISGEDVYAKISLVCRII